MRAVLLRALFASWLCACASAGGAAPGQPAGTHESSDARAARLAPDLHARAHEAELAAQQASGETQDDLEAVAALLREASLVEADRVELERKRHASEEREEQQELARAELDRKRLAVEARVRRSEAARIARAEASRVFAMAVADERPGRAQDLESERREAAAWLIGRAQLTLAAALALGLEAPRGQAAREAIERAQRMPQASATNGRLEAARAALEAAERAVGEARALRPGPSRQEQQALLEMAAERGVPAALDARGLVLDLTGAMAPRGSALTPRGRKLLEHVGAIARAHPHGVLRVEIDAKPAQRARALIDALAKHVEPARVQLGESALPDPARIFIVLLAYGDPQPTSAQLTPALDAAAPGRTE
jgi:hypothetical protein